LQARRLRSQQQDLKKEVTMKKHVYFYFATMILLGVLGVSTQAQSRSSQQLRVDIPFAFNVGNTLLPAGEYRVKVVNPSSDRSVLQIASLDGRTTMMVRTVDIEGWSTSRAKLTFRQYGDQYFLAQVWMAAESAGFATPHSSAEKTRRRQLGQAGKNYDLVAVNAR
jgi:hypothetical protein